MENIQMGGLEALKKDFKLYQKYALEEV